MNSSFNLGDLDLSALAATSLGMDDDDISVPDSPSSESGMLSPDALERQRASLQTYLNALPYECESPEDMQARLEYIVGRICICAETKNWLVLTTWDGMLQWYVSPHSASRRVINPFFALRAQLASHALPDVQDKPREAYPPLLRVVPCPWHRTPRHAQLGRHALSPHL